MSTVPIQDRIRFRIHMFKELHANGVQHIDKQMMSSIGERKAFVEKQVASLVDDILKKQQEAENIIDANMKDISAVDVFQGAIQHQEYLKTRIAELHRIKGKLMKALADGKTALEQQQAKTKELRQEISLLKDYVKRSQQVPTHTQKELSKAGAILCKNISQYTKE